MADEPTSKPDSPSSDDPGLFDFPDFGALFRRFGGWCRGNPASAALLAALFAVAGYFYFGIKAFLSLSQSAAQWIAASWNAENDQEHCWLIIPVAILLALLRWRDLTAAGKEPSNAGLWFIAAGILAFVAGVRCVEGRYTIFALPLLCYGATRFLFGRETARIVLFPCVFLLFMTPLGMVVQSTANLQSTTAKIIESGANVLGMKIYSIGATIYSANNSFEPLEVAGGCSGIRSLMAMLTLAALYGYFAMRTPVRGLVLFCGSVVFAMIGNTVRVFSVVIAAKLFGAGFADSYHDYSAFVFFPVAVVAMVVAGNFLNRDWSGLFAAKAPALKSAADIENTGEGGSKTPPDAPEQGRSERARYDY